MLGDINRVGGGVGLISIIIFWGIAIPQGATAQLRTMAMNPPKVAISFPDVGDYDFLNETVAVMSNSNAAFEMMCNATYPIEWIFHYDGEDDGTSEKVKLADTYRYADEFSDPQSYRYSAKLRLEYNGKLLVLSNFTCKSTESDHPLYQTHVYMKEREGKSVLLLEVANGEYKGGSLVSSQSAPNNTGNCDKAVARVEYPLWRRNPCWKCLEPKGKELELDFQWCKTPIQCNSMHRRQRRGKDCLDVVDVEEVSPGCKSESVAFFPRLILCKNFGPALAQFYFFGVFKGKWEDDDVDGPPIYFSWEDANPLDMLYIHPIQEKVYLGEEIEFKCEYSKYYFSLGSWIGVSSPSGTEYIQGFDVKQCETDSEERNSNTYHNCYKKQDVKRPPGTFHAMTKITFKEVGHHQVFCFGPVWNTTQWVNASHSFVVEMGEEPQVTTLSSDTDESFIIGQENRSLHCNFKGRPEPKVTWEGPPDSFWTLDSTPSNSILRLREIGKKSSGVYSCTVSSFLGNHTQTFTIHSHLPSAELSGSAIAGIVVGCVLLLVFVLAVIGRLTLIIVRQRKALRLLTESEVQDFLKGNPELAKGKMEFLDNQFAIDALAYDQRYEIGPEKLAVDYTNVLGSGQFGVVLKGKMKLSNSDRAVSVYLNFEDDGANLSSEEVVAVKTTKKDVDVTSFKGILSEVKVMAYLGQHKNIVSLMGASTHNIRNRELLIAVEYCDNGSLDGFLKQNKKHFVNMVTYGYFAMEGEKEETKIVNENPAYMNLQEVEMSSRKKLARSGSGWEFSSLDLFLWTHDIAQGVEYIHDKKVIHGDLAIRNVLLTSDFTAKVGDFGLSRQLGGMSNYIKKTQCPLPWRNMAVESLKEMNFSPRSDIWSLGVTIWELFTLGDCPYPGMAYSMEFLRDLDTGSLRLYKPPNATNDLYELLLMMWQSNPEDRPSTAEVKVLCEKLFKKARVNHQS